MVLDLVVTEISLSRDFPKYNVSELGTHKDLPATAKRDPAVEDLNTMHC
jgi:hypothetical protein